MAYIEPPKGRLRWREGAPPSVGWWPASVGRLSNILRWWDGKNWSSCASPTDDAEEAARCAAAKAPGGNDGIEWCARWWE